MDLAQSSIGIAAFSLFILPAGFLAGTLVDVQGFRQRSRAEQLLWSITLGLPLGVLFSVSLARLFRWQAVSSFFLAATLSAIFVLMRSKRRPASALPEGRYRTIRVGALLALVPAAYGLLALTDVQIGHRLFISTVMSDWAVRVPIVDAALGGQVPPPNPLSALEGFAPPLHYYYYWYVFCAQIARLAHIPGRAALTASCVWSGYGLVSVLFLSLKYLLGLRQNLRSQALVALAILPVMGLDVIPVGLKLLIHRQHPDFEMEWWREDRTPSFISTILYAPHHIAGMAFALGAFLVLVGLLRQRPPFGRCLLLAALTGACFAAVAGTSTYVAFIFALVCLLWSIDLVRMREWRLLGILALCGVIALALSQSYLHELLTTSSGNQLVAGKRGAVHFAVVRVRSLSFGDRFLERHHLHPRSALLYQFLRLGPAVVLGVAELGFFLFVLVHRVRRDIFSPRSLTPNERAAWALFAGIALPALLLSSAVVSGANDLGMHAGILLRLLLLLWGTPWVYERWRTRRQLADETRARKLFLAGAALALFLGWCGQLLQLVLERGYLPMVETRALNKKTDVMTSDHLGERLYNIRESYRALGHLLPGDAIVQYDPGNVMQLAFSLYSNRQIAASDDGCGTGFGGDHALCNPVYMGLRRFYGLVPHKSVESLLPLDDRGSQEEPIEAASYTAKDGDFRLVCHDLRLSAILADSKDPAWNRHDSWVWTEPAVFTSSTARAYLCPGAPTLATAQAVSSQAGGSRSDPSAH